jgi:hypothetical protein
MCRNVAVQNFAASVLDDKETIQHSERHRRHSKEIERGDHLAVILQKSQPLLLGVTAAYDAPQISGYGSFRDGKAKLLQFRVNFGSAPIGILFGQTLDQTPEFLCDPRSAAAGTRPPAPIKAEASAMPADNGLWFDNEEDIVPAGPEAAEDGPKETVSRIQRRPWPFAFEYGDLLAESEDLQDGVASRTKESAECTQHGEEELEHEFTVVARRGSASTPKSRSFPNY